MFQRSVVGGVLGAALSIARPAGAEAGAPACPFVDVIEVFAGAPGCEDVGYALVEVSNLDFLAAESSYLTLGSYPDDDGELVNLEAWRSQASSPVRLLLGSDNLEEYFGIEPDLVVGPPFPLRPDGGWIEGCGATRYGAGGGLQINACEGQAIRWLDWRTAELVEPAPVNSKGEQGELTGCDPRMLAPGEGSSDGGAALDAGVSRDASLELEPLCVQLNPKPEPSPVEPDPTEPTPTAQNPTEPSASSSDAPEDPPVSSGADDSGDPPTNPDDLDSDPSDDPPNPTLPDESDAREAGSTAASGDDTGSGPSDGGASPGVAQRGVADEAGDSGCQCAVGAGAQTRGSLFAGSALLSMLLARRLRGRGRR